MTQQKTSPRINNRLAKAETILFLALAVDQFFSPLIFSYTHFPPFGQTLLKMALVVGLFGPVFNLLKLAIDGSLSATRSATERMLWMPRLATHAVILAVLFLGYYWTMHHSVPWNAPRSQAVSQR